MSQIHHSTATQAQRGPLKLGVMSKSLHITLITETYAPEINGVATTLSRLCDGLRLRGHRVEVIRPRQNDDE